MKQKKNNEKVTKKGTIEYYHKIEPPANLK